MPSESHGPIAYDIDNLHKVFYAHYASVRKIPGSIVLENALLGTKAALSAPTEVLRAIDRSLESGVDREDFVSLLGKVDQSADDLPDQLLLGGLVE